MPRRTEGAAPRLEPALKLDEIAARIDELAARSSVLEPGRGDRKRMRDEVIAYTERFLDRLPTARTFNRTEDEGAGILDCPIAEEGRPASEVVQAIEAWVDRPALNPASAGHLGYIPGGGVYPSSLGDYIAAVTNHYSGIYFASPGAVRMNHLLIRWMADLAGYPEGAGGDLASGGSIATLTAVVTAREAKKIGSADVPRAVIYMTRHVHYCVDKALAIAGLRESQVRQVETDARFRMSPADLAAKVEADRAAGLRPFMVVASAGTTDTGAVDPIGEIAEIAESHDLWFHADAAYGGFFALCPEAPGPIHELCRTDSVVLDPHKGLFLPYGSGAVLVRDRELLRRAHAHASPVLRDARDAAGTPSPADHSPELSRHFRAMRMWLPLQLFGVAPFRACLSEKFWLARYLYEGVRQLPQVETGPEPDLTVFLFRRVPSGLAGETQAVNAANQALIRRIQADGRFFISSTTLGGEIWLRFAVLSFRTRRKHVDLALKVLGELVSS